MAMYAYRNMDEVEREGCYIWAKESDAQVTGYEYVVELKRDSIVVVLGYMRDWREAIEFAFANSKFLLEKEKSEVLEEVVDWARQTLKAMDSGEYTEPEFTYEGEYDDDDFEEFYEDEDEYEWEDEDEDEDEWEDEEEDDEGDDEDYD